MTFCMSLELMESKSFCCERGCNPPLPANVAAVDVFSTASTESVFAEHELRPHSLMHGHQPG